MNYYSGYECIIAHQMKKQNKTSKYKIVNWVYKKVYGYKYKSTFPEGIDVVMIDNKLIVRDRETFDKIKNNINNAKILVSNDVIFY